MKMNPWAGAALVLTLAFSAHAQTYQVANSTGGQQVAGAPIAQSIAYVTSLANNAQGTANNAQSTANWSGQVAQDARQAANNAQAVASNAQGVANRALNGVNVDYEYIVITAANSCAATAGGVSAFPMCLALAYANMPRP
ncbi:alanine-zipper protein [Variovorax sp. 2RAF20]|uniref:alanine-zipper protein n=1 Tax=Variovorax sp. CF313 TaxID=1144315 RepID=UPI00027110E5|nr:alanine-zipper protein [Variovorax sp. CF313]EJL79290.1 hypothetical protein PMI12_00730 [Variovorax sp. CF313]